MPRQRLGQCITNFDVLLTVHLSIFILVIIQLDAKSLFNNKFISCLYMLVLNKFCASSWISTKTNWTKYVSNTSVDNLN